MKIKDLEILGLETDSRKIKNGFLFAAIRGEKDNGEKYIQQAIENGAIAILKEGVESCEYINGILQINSPNPRIELAKLAKMFYVEQPKKISAITGTNGKTSTAEFCRQILRFNNIKAASIGTLGTIIDDYKYQECLTTPDTLSIHKILYELVKSNITDVVIEASSHALSQYRLNELDISNGLWTNFSQDHLDYHHTLDNYFKAKCKLMDLVKDNFIYNADDKKINDYMNSITSKKLVSFGDQGKDLKILEILRDKNGMLNLKILFFGKQYEIPTNLSTKFQIYNLIAAILISYFHGCKENEIFQQLNHLKTPIGRMDLIQKLGNRKIFIDFAHTPDGLEKALLELVEIRKNKILLVFGCGGDRDPQKRSIMGKIAKKFADIIIVTDDNPRTENPKAIRKEILSGISDAIEIPDREEAIIYAIKKMEPDDILLIAGKGHENFQIIGDKKIPFNDKKIAEDFNCSTWNF